MNENEFIDSINNRFSTEMENEGMPSDHSECEFSIDQRYVQETNYSAINTKLI